MNKMINDFNQEVTVIGQEGSIAWVKERYPRAIKRTNSLFDAGQYNRQGVFSALEDARKEMEYDNIPNEHISTILKISQFTINGFN